LVNSSLDLKEFGFEAYIIHTPGHTIGSMSIVVDNEVALVGDTLFGIFKWSVFPPYANDVKQLVKSWGILLDTNCPVFIPSHGSANSRSLVQNDYDKRNYEYPE
jgi:hydroxyacylglutathione hydrolase